MRRFRSAASFFATFIIWTPAMAAGSSCDAILEWGVKNTYNSPTDEAAATAIYKENCGTKAESMTEDQRAKASVSITGEGSGDVSLDQAATNKKIDEWCDKNKQDITSTSKSVIAATNIFAPSVNAWRQCKQMEFGGTQLNPSFAPNEMGATFNIKYTGEGTGVLFYGVSTKHFTCKVTAPAQTGDGIIDVTEAEFKKGI